jgi:endonuclease YncB( thermonuclease family)
LAFGKPIRVEKETIDRYGRTVGTALVADQAINAEPARRGMAWVYRRYAHRQGLYTIEKEAQEAKRALWSSPNPILHGNTAMGQSSPSLAQLSQPT